MLDKALETNNKFPPIDRVVEKIMILETEIEEMRKRAFKGFTEEDEEEGIDTDLLLSKIKELEKLKSE